MFHRKPKIDESKKTKSNERPKSGYFPNIQKQKSTESGSNLTPLSSNKKFSFDRNSKTLSPNPKKNMTNSHKIVTDSNSITNLMKDIENLKSTFKAEIDYLKKENDNLKSEMNDTKTEILKLVSTQNYSQKNNLNELDVGIRVLNKVVRDNHDHYEKFVPFVIENMLQLMKKQEYMCHRQKTLQNGKFKKTFQNEFNTSYCSNSTNSNFRTYSICISPFTDKDMYKLVFEPLDNINISKIIEEGKEQIYSIPSSNVRTIPLVNHSNSVPLDKSDLPNKVLLGSKTLPYYIKRLQNSLNQNEVLHKNKNTSEFKFNNIEIGWSSSEFKNNEDNPLLNNFPTSNLKFRDLKKRYVRWKHRTFQSNSYPNLTKQRNNIEMYNDKVRNREIENEDCDYNEFLCQSETEIIGNKYSINSQATSQLNSDENSKYQEMLLYQSLTKSTIVQLRKFELKEYPSEENIYNKTTQEFSIILPRSKLSSILSNNFTNISEALISSDEEVIPEGQDSLPFYKKIDDSDYFTYIPKHQINPSVKMASFDTISDDQNYMDDDYGQQYLLSNQNSYEELCATLDKFNLPNSSVNDIFKKFK